MYVRNESDFRSQLKAAKEQVEEAARQQELKAQQEARERERTQQRALNLRKNLIDRHVNTSKPMVERLIRDLGDEAWGRGNYGIEFGANTQAWFSSEGQLSGPEDLATWSVGHEEYYANRYAFGFWSVRGHYSVPLGCGPRHEDDEFSSREYYCVSLCAQGGLNSPYFRTTYESRTTGFEKEELKNVLREEFLRGPKRMGRGRTGYRGMG